jgi:hypothetical protein
MKQITYDSLERIRERFLKRCKTNSARSYIESVTFASGYAEPGYSDPESGWIAFGNWNKITKYVPEKHEFETLDSTPCEFAEILEKIGVGIEWGDEWTTCDYCHKAVRTSPDSYGWTQSYAIFNECELVCHECIKDDPSGYIEEMIGDTGRAMTIDIDLAEHGFVLLESDFENGFHPGQDADPKVIGKSLEQLGVDRFIFVIDDVGQFDISFSVWVDKDQLADLDMSEWENADKDGPSVSEGLKRALQAAAAIPKGDGIQIINCDASTGTATARNLTPDEFVNGG